MIRRRRRRKARIPLWAYVVTGVALASGIWTIPPKTRTWREIERDATPRSEQLPVRAAVDRGSGRPVYRHSVIAGGAYSVAEVERARLGDPVVFAHYAVFDPASLRMTEAPAARSAYVSYRIGSDVYWTRNRVELPAGEALITDGAHEARARCGNRIEDTAQEPVAVDEPPADDLDAVEPPVLSETDWRLRTALVVDLFPTFRPSRMALSWPASPDPSAQLSVATAQAASDSLAIPMLMTGPVIGPGLQPFALDQPTRPIPGATSPLPPLVAFAPPLPNQIAVTWRTGPLPVTWSSWTLTTLPGSPGIGLGSSDPWDLPVQMLPPPIPDRPQPGTPDSQVPEPATAILLAGGIGLAVLARIRRRV